jgi:hypothetical protein
MCIAARMTFLTEQISLTLPSKRMTRRASATQRLKDPRGPGSVNAGKREEAFKKNVM